MINNFPHNEIIIVITLIMVSILVSLFNDKGMAKAYQGRQVIKAIDLLELNNNANG